MTDKVKESTEYESLIGVQEKPNADLTSFMPELDEVVVEEPWKKHWKEMPEYKQENKSTYKTIQLHFRNKEDCIIASHPSSGQKRISLSEKIINNAKEVIFHVTGSGKKYVIDDTLHTS